MIKLNDALLIIVIIYGAIGIYNLLTGKNVNIVDNIMMIGVIIIYINTRYIEEKIDKLLKNSE